MKITIKIDAKFGSKFREEYAPKSLEIMIKAWVASEESFNKKTKIYCTIEKPMENIIASLNEKFNQTKNT